MKPKADPASKRWQSKLFDDTGPVFLDFIPFLEIAPCLIAIFRERYGFGETGKTRRVANRALRSVMAD